MTIAFVQPREFAPEPEEPPAPTEAELLEQRWQRGLSRMSVPASYRQIPRSLRLVSEIANWSGDPWSVTIFGPNGSGKTWQAVRLLARVFGAAAADNFGTANCAFFANASLLVEAIRMEIATPQDGCWFRHACTAPGLLLDDYTALRGSEFGRDRTSMILRARYDAMRPTIITADCADLSVLAESEPRIASRLAAGIVFTLDGRDRRLPRNA